MTTLTTEPLGADVGAEIVGAHRDRLLTDEAFPTFCLEALEAHGVLVFRGLEPRRRDAGRVQQAARSGRGLR